MVPARAGAQPTAAPPVVLDGPTTAIPAPSGLDTSIARDGTGGLVYLKQVSGTAHVFVSSLLGGVFQPPVEVDAALPGASSQPVIAAGSAGTLVVAFINAGNLYVVSRPSAATPLSAPRLLAGAASNPSLQMTIFNKAYLAFTAADGAGSDVRAAYYDQGAWALEGSPLNVTPADDAGTGTGRPAVAAANDGVGIVAWGENGHVLTRRVWGTSPSVVFEQADAGFGGCSEASADEPAIGSGGDSSYAAVAFHETVSCGGQTQSRVLMNRLRGSLYMGEVTADGVTSAEDGADDPQVAINEYGRGWVTSAHAVSGNVFALAITDNEGPGSVSQLNSLGNASAPDAIPATAGFSSTFIAWQHDPGGFGVPDIRLRFANNGGSLSSEGVLSNPAQGAADGGAGLAAAGDVNGDAAVAWVQSTSAGREIVTDQLYQPPGFPTPQAPSGDVRSTRPTLSWGPTNESWGPARYSVSLDGSALGQTSATALRPPAALRQGPHRWFVEAINPAGQTSSVASRSFFVDTIAPVVKLAVAGKRLTGSLLRVHVTATDAPPPLPGRDASGVKRVVVHWGDHTKADVIAHWGAHVYKRAGRYRVTVTVVDRAGNQTVKALVVTVKAAPAPSPGH